MNRVVIVGRLTKDIELKYSASGTAIANFTVAVNRTFANSNGDREADFINVVTFKKSAENAANYLKKGSLVGIDGRVQTRNYEGQDGKRIYITEIVADSVQFLEPKSTGGQNNTPNNQPNTNTSGGQEKPPANQNKGYTRMDEDPFAGNGQVDISDSDLPF